MDKYLVSVTKQERPSCEGAVTSKTTGYVRSSERSSVSFVKVFIKRLKKLHTGIVITHATPSDIVVEKRVLGCAWSIRWIIKVNPVDLEGHNREVFSTVKAIAGENLNDFDCVISVDGVIKKASIDNYDIIGIAARSVELDETAVVILSGTVSNAKWNWEEGSNVVMDRNGNITQDVDETMPLVIVGRAVSKTAININILIVKTP
jgi:hypothetical protein